MFECDDGIGVRKRSLKSRGRSVSQMYSTHSSTIRAGFGHHDHSMNRHVGKAREIAKFRNAVKPLLDRVQPRRVALALSGGADSVALSWLWHNAFGDRWPLHAIIFDHKIRPESSQEAYATAECFKRLTGREARITSCLWLQRLAQPVTESQARTARYLEMGKMCLENDFDCLLTGHHADDQAETVLKRALESKFSGGHSGMYELTLVPECDSLATKAAFDAPCDSLEWRTDPKSPTTSRHYDPMPQLPTQIIRPLLSYSKIELYQICKDQGLHWSEDRTNRDVTFTVRNAIRHVLTSGGLPRAFQTSRLLALSHQSQKYQQEINAEVERVYATARTRIDPRTGMLTMTLPLRIHLNRPVVLECIRQILVSIAPGKQGTTRERQALARVIQDVHNAKLQSVSERDWVRKVSQQSPVVADVKMTADLTMLDDTQLCIEWKFRCLPTSNSSPRKHCESKLIPLPADNGHKSLAARNWPTPKLWDNRFFLAVRVHDSDSLSIPAGALVVRPLGNRDLNNFLSKKTLPESDAVKLKHKYRQLLRQNVGYLPAIPALCIVTPSEQMNQHSEEVPKRHSLSVIEDIIAIPALRYVKSSEWERRVIFELAHKPLHVLGVEADPTVLNLPPKVLPDGTTSEHCRKSEA